MNMPQTKSKERKTDRILILKPVEGEKPISSTGMTDPRLFSGENKLHLYKDPRNNIWAFKYEMGGLPEPLKQRFTGFDLALDVARKYYGKRNVEIADVID